MQSNGGLYVDGSVLAKEWPREARKDEQCQTDANSGDRNRRTTGERKRNERERDNKRTERGHANEWKEQDYVKNVKTEMAETAMRARSGNGGVGGGGDGRDDLHCDGLWRRGGGFGGWGD